ncbi:MAG TPA: aminotransferase class IV [Blastocatellia bacterium]
MDRLIFQNDRIVEAARSHLSTSNAGALYGWGVFTTIRIFEGAVFAFDRHWERLKRHAEQAQVPMPVSSDDLIGALLGLISANSTRNGRARITLLRCNAGPWKSGAGPDTELLIFTTTDEPRPAENSDITISPYRVLSHGPLAGVKRTAMLDHLLALEEARSRGFSEAVMVNERGEITAGTAANIFWTSSDELFTPSLATGCIAGITREVVLEIARGLNLRVTEGSFPIQRLLDADELFLTSTSRGIAPVDTFDIKAYDRGASWVTGLIEREFQKLAADATM